MAGGGRGAEQDHEEPDEGSADEEERQEEDEYSRGAPRLPWGITKKVIREAPVENWEAGRPKCGDQVHVHLVSKLQDGTQVGTSRDKDKPFTFMIDQKPREVPVGLDLAVMTMRRDEIAEFKVAPRFAYEDLGTQGVPPGATMLFEVELLSWETQEDIFGDGCAIKTVLRAGDGETRPERGQEVIVSLKCLDRKENVLEEHQQLEHNVGDPIFGPLSRAVASTLTGMSEGERASVALSRDYAPNDRRFAKAVLQLELERVFEARDVSLAQDKSLIKKVLSKGEGGCPTDTSRVRLHVEAAIDASEPLYGFSGPKTFEFVPGEGDVCDALEFAARHMRVQERSILKCAPPMPQCLELELGLVNIQAQTAFLTVQLLSIEAGVDPSALPPSERLAFIRSRKEKAAGLYKRQRYALASEAYRSIVELVGSAATVGEEEQEAQELRPICQLNRAACMLKLNDFVAARSLCDDVLASDADSVKALYRRASASFGLSDYESALQDLAKVLTLDAKNVEARKLVAQVKEAQKRYARDARQTAARMIAGKDADISPVRDVTSADARKEEHRLPAACPERAAAKIFGQLSAISACLPLAPCMRLVGRLGW